MGNEKSEKQRVLNGVISLMERDLGYLHKVDTTSGMSLKATTKGWDGRKLHILLTTAEEQELFLRIINSVKTRKEEQLQIKKEELKKL